MENYKRKQNSLQGELQEIRINQILVRYSSIRNHDIQTLEGYPLPNSTFKLAPSIIRRYEPGKPDEEA